MDPRDRYSDGSESSDAQRYMPVDDRDLNDRDINDRDLTRQRSPTLSSGSPPLTPNGHHDGHHHHTRDRDRHTEVLKMLMNEEHAQSRSTRKFLRTALARLDNETLRAQKAEQHALEIAQRFKVISDAHRQLQSELARANEELRLYKVEYSNAQRELDRGRDIVRTLETQRDDAEARAAKDRTTARRLKEEQLMIRAREEGRKAGYAEGIRRGLEQARFERLRSTDGDDGTLSGFEPDSAMLESQSDPLEDLGVRNLTSPIANTINIESPVPQHIIPPLGVPPPGEQGSRFREHGIGATPGIDTTSLASTSQQWPSGPPISIHNDPPFSQHPDTSIPPDGWIPKSNDGVISIPPPHELQHPHSPHSPSQPLPVPLRPPSMASEQTDRGQSNGSDYPYNRRNSAGSIPLSIPSTTISQFDLVSAPGDTPRAPFSDNGHNRKSSLSVIHEVSSSMEFSPATDSRNMPEPITFPTTAAEHMVASDQFPMQLTRSRQISQRLADELRYDDPNAAQQWRQSAEFRTITPKQSMPRRRPSNVTMPSPLSPASQPRELRPPSAASGRSSRYQPHRPSSVASRASDVDSSVNGRHPPSSSAEWNIEVIPPSGTASATFSPVTGPELDMLSPNAVPLNLPPPQPVAPPVPTVPNSPSMGRYPSMGALPNVQPGGIPHIYDLPPGFQPIGPVTPMSANTQPLPSGAPVTPRSTTPSIYGAPPAQIPIQRSASSSSSRLGNGDAPLPMHTRSRSVGGSSLGSAGEEIRSKTPIIRPPSSASTAHRSVYATAPTPAGMQYPAAPGPPGTPGANMSPRSVASRLSGGHQRSLSMNAGSTPAPSTRPLSTAPPPKLRRVPSAESIDSAVSGISRHSQYDHYRPSEYVDPAFLASSEDLTNANMLSPNTRANTRANTVGSRKSVHASRPASRNSDALSYVSMQK